MKFRNYLTTKPVIKWLDLDSDPEIILHCLCGLLSNFIQTENVDQKKKKVLFSFFLLSLYQKAKSYKKLSMKT